MNGDGPCNKERLATRVKAHDDGLWVRKAAPRLRCQTSCACAKASRIKEEAKNE